TSARLSLLSRGTKTHNKGEALSEGETGRHGFRGLCVRALTYRYAGLWDINTHTHTNREIHVARTHARTHAHTHTRTHTHTHTHTQTRTDQEGQGYQISVPPAPVFVCSVGSQQQADEDV